MSFIVIQASAARSSSVKRQEEGLNICSVLLLKMRKKKFPDKKAKTCHYWTRFPGRKRSLILCTTNMDTYIIFCIYIQIFLINEYFYFLVYLSLFYLVQDNWYKKCGVSIYRKITIILWEAVRPVF